jgi:PAS domain S-box-containing protein
MNTTPFDEHSSQADQAVKESERRYQRLLASVTDYVYLVTVDDGRAAATSHGPGCEAVTGFTPGEFEADPYLWFRMVHEEDRPAVTERAERILRGESPPPLEHRIVRKDGTIRWIRNTVVPRKDEQGRLVMYDGLVSDITERRRAEEQLCDAYSELSQRQTDLKKTLQELTAAHEELKAAQLQLIQAAKLESVGTLAAGVAHEVKNPLQTIVMGLDYLSGDPAPPKENIKMVLSDMREAVARAHAIIQELLQLSAQRDFEMKSEDLNLLLCRSLFLLQNEIVASQTSVARRFGAELPRVKIDRGKMEQVFVNLFLNALQAMPQGGVLTISSRVESFSGDLNVAESVCLQLHHGDPVVVVEVRDTGTGIAEADLPRIFDPFFTTKPVGVGTGLGLSVVKNIVALHGGAIAIRNAPGGGALATVVLKAEPEGRP